VVFVTVGNATQPFLRLLQAVDKAAGRGDFGGEPVLVQSGYSNSFRPQHCENRPFINMDEFGRLIGTSSLIICHGGCTQLEIIGRGKVPIVMPRMRKHGEHVNDHQVQLVRQLELEDRIVAVYEPECLSPPRSAMLSLVAEAIRQFAGEDVQT
jgi:UDP-N-acetylglucosamine transferase subunit ALG13